MFLIRDLPGRVDQPVLVKRDHAVGFAGCAVLGLVITCVIVLPFSLLLFFALHRMERLKTLKLTVRFTPLPTLSFEADAGGGPKEPLPVEDSRCHLDNERPKWQM